MRDPVSTHSAHPSHISHVPLALTEPATDAPVPSDAQVYEFSSGSNDWVQIGSTLNGDAVGDEFGTAVALSADGIVLAVGASSNDAGGNVSSGHVKCVLGASAPTMSRSKPHVSHTHCCSHMTSVF